MFKGGHNFADLGVDKLYLRLTYFQKKKKSDKTFQRKIKILRGIKNNRFSIKIP